LGNAMMIQQPVAETQAKAAFACALIAGRASTLLTDLAYH
jgi:hypothetical protein